MNSATVATASKPDIDTTAFHCSAEWHLIRLGKYAVAIHALMLRVQGDDLDFFGSIGQIAEYFRANERHIRTAIHKLIKVGFVVRIGSRSGQSTVYRALTHKEWAEQHPEQCAKKRDTTGQGSMEFKADPSPKGGGVQNSAGGVTNSATETAPLPEKGSTPLPQRGGHPSPKGGDKSPNKSPNSYRKIVDTAALKAAQSACRLFCEDSYGDMDAGDEQTAFKMVLWVLYRAAVAGEIPRTVAYYKTARNNFVDQHEPGWENILDTAEDKFCKNTYRFVEANSPDLLQWLKEKARQLQEQTQPLPV